MRKSRTLGRLRERTRTTRPDPDSVPLYAEIAQQVAEERVRRNLSQAELAELCATTQSAIARVERGARPPRIDTLLRIAGALDCALVVQLKARTKVEKERGKR